MSADLTTPVVTIVSVVLTQLFTLHVMRRQAQVQLVAQREHELWKFKYEAYTQALGVTTKYFHSIVWGGHKFSGPSPTTEEYGHALAKLRLLTDNGRMARAFIASFGMEPQEGDKPVIKRNVFRSDFNALIRLMREDLGKGLDPTPEMDFALIDFSQASAQGLPPGPGAPVAPVSGPTATQSVE